MKAIILNKKFNDTEELKEFTKYLFIHRQKDRRNSMDTVNKLVSQYEKEYRAGNHAKIKILEASLRKFNVSVDFSVDLIYFTNCETDDIIYSFEL